MEKSIKIVLIVLLLLCLFKMPYGFYQLVRFLALVGFCIFSYKAYMQQKEVNVFFYGALALLFQPFFKIALGKTFWNVIDVIVAVGLLLTLINSQRNQKQNGAS